MITISPPPGSADDHSTQPPVPPTKTVVVVMGVAGSGKTTVALQLAARLGWAFAEADDFHPDSNLAKMSAGIPLTDEDRKPWLIDLRRWLDDCPGHALITCSALRRSYREVLNAADARVRYVHLDGTVEQLTRRLAARVGHFMPAAMLASQIATLERLQPDEDGFAVGIDAPAAQLGDRILAQLGAPDPVRPVMTTATVATGGKKWTG